MHGGTNGMELVIAGDLLDHLAAAVVFKDDEVAEEFKKTMGFEKPLDHYLQGRQVRLVQSFAGDGPPGFEPLPPGGQSSHAGLHAVRENKQFIWGEERGDLGLVSLELLKGGPDRGALVGCVLQLEGG